MKKIFLSLFLLFFAFSAFSKSVTEMLAVYNPSFVDIYHSEFISSSKLICEKLKSSVEECFDSFDEVVIISDKEELKSEKESLQAIIITKFINKNNAYYIKSSFVDIKSKTVIAEAKSDVMPDLEVFSDSQENLINQVISRLSEKYYSDIKNENDIESEFDIDDYIIEENFSAFCHLGFTGNLDCNFGADLDFHVPIDDSLFFYLDLGLMPRISEVYDKSSNWVLYPDILLGAGLNKSFSSINVYGLLAVGIWGCGTDYFEGIFDFLFNEETEEEKNKEKTKEYRDIGFAFRVALGLDYKISENLALYTQYNFDVLFGAKDNKNDTYSTYSNTFTIGLGFLY